MPPPERPPFPPPALQLPAAFPVELGDALGSELLMVWAFLHSFGELLGLWPATVDELLAAVALGERSRLLGEIHVGLLRLLQADMEEAHASGATQVPPLIHNHCFEDDVRLLKGRVIRVGYKHGRLRGNHKFQIAAL